MQKTSLLCLSLLLNPCFVGAMEQKALGDKNELTKKDNFPKLQKFNKKSSPTKNSSQTNNNQIVLSNENEIKENNNNHILSNSIDKGLENLIFNSDDDSSSQLMKPRKNSNEKQNIIEFNNVQEQPIVDNNNNFISIESSSPIEQQRRGFFGKLLNSTKSYRGLALEWLKSDSIDKQWRDQAQNDIKWAIIEENAAVKKNRNGNENFITIFQEVQKNPSSGHSRALQMLEYLKKNEDNTGHIDKFVHADGKGLPFDTAGLLEDTYKTLETEKKHDLFVLALVTQEVQRRVQEYQKTCNYIYNMTKDNKNVVGVNSTDDYNDASVLFTQSQQLMNVVKQKLVEKENK